ncbi:universal stress protein [Desulfomonile tiedjei]|uniref:Universal stress protein n=1 Tax=Desulfomonile tiedjei (strain ATCC 49306 / DSM 6799 / DCB-1) TaxID=706587 RepID=I4C512_DESTA|nr:universal stress protein [Desulfomonile tiedjei]AFM24653.1 universal stress protein UspA-like protein [Desulfomonile tiedjei DSM 6799]
MLPKKILFCADFSVNSLPARQLAVDYAKAFGAELLIIHVIDATGFPSYVDWVGKELDQILERTQNAAAARLEELAEEYGSLIPVKPYCTIGSAPKEIVELAARESVDLIVMGTHGRTGVKHLVMGSIARSVLRSAHRPVLIVEAPTEKGESSERPYEFPVP